MVIKNPLQILMVEDNEGDEFLLSELIDLSGILVSSLFKMRNLGDAIQCIQQSNVDIILLDLSLPDSSGIATFKSLRGVAPNVPIIIFSGMTDMNLALEAINMGAQDYLIKGDFNEKLLAKTILYSIERVRNLNELKESNIRYNLISMATNDMVWDWDLLTGVVYRNEAGWKKIFRSAGEPSTNGTERDWDHRIHPDDVEKFEMAKAGIFRSLFNDSFEVECRVKRDDGSYAYIRDSGNIIRDNFGKPVRIIGATQDITRRKEAEQVLKESEERYRHLFHNNPASIFIWDIETLRILEVNHRALAEYGYTREEFLARTILDHGVSKHTEKVNAFIASVRSGQEFQRVNTSKHINKAGEHMYLSIASHKIVYQGRPAILALATNITETLLLERVLEKERHQKQMEITDAVISAQEAERQEIGIELHDNINQILASSRLYLGVVKAESGETHPYINETDSLIKSAIDEIRCLSHSLIPPSLNESELLLALKQITQVTRQTSGLDIAFETTGFKENSISDKLKLTIYRIVQEQFNNILKYANAAKIMVVLEQNAQMLLLKIKDDGIGFDTTIKGSGVGLTNIRTRAALFNGDVKIKSSPGMGCELNVHFPQLVDDKKNQIST